MISRKFALQAGAYAGFISAGFVAAFTLLSLTSFIETVSLRLLDISYIVGAGLVPLVYWYGIFHFGKMYKNTLIVAAAVLGFLIGIATDALNALFVYAPLVFLDYSGITQIVIAFGTFAVFACAGFGMLRLRPQFGGTAHAYGIASLLLAALSELAFLGTAEIVGLLFGILNVTLFICGSILLLRAMRTR
jgi:hypothetical protein